MPTPPWSPEIGQSLVDRGHIDQSTFDKVYPPNQSVAAPAPDPMAFDPSQAPAPPPAPIFERFPPPSEAAAMPAEEYDPRAAQRAFWQEKKAKDDQAIAASEQRVVDNEQADLMKRRETAKKMGYSQAEIDTNIPLTPMQPQSAPAPVDDPNLKPAVPAGAGGPAMPDYNAQLKGFMNPLDVQKAAVLEAAKAGERQGAEAVAYHERIEKEANERDKKNIEADDKNRLELRGKLTELNNYADDIGKQKIDPERYWNNKSTGDKVLAALALGMGGAAASRGGSNPAMQMMESAINRDIDAQKSEINSAKDKYNAKAGIYNDMFNLFKDERAAKAAAMVNYLEIAQHQLGAINARYSGAAAKAQGNLLAGQIDEKKAVYKQQFEAAIQRKQMMDNLTSGKGGFNPELLAPEDRERAVGDGQKFYGLATSKAGAEAIRTLMPDVEMSRKNLAELIDIGKMSRLGKLSPTLKNRALVLTKSLQGSMRLDLLGPGTVQEHERKMLDEIIVNPSKIMSLGNESAQLQVLLDRVNDRWKITLGAHNLYLPEDRRKNEFGFQPDPRRK